MKQFVDFGGDIQSDLKTEIRERLSDWLKSQSNIKVWLTV